MSTQKQIDANRANAQKSTGPKTADGKRRSKLNSLRHGLTGQRIVGYGDDLDAYESHSRVFAGHYRPANPMEKQIVQQLADTQWRLNRAAAIDANFFGLFDYECECSNDPYPDSGLGKAEAFEKNLKNFGVLTLYEQRLQRAFDKLLARLKVLREERASQTPAQTADPVQQENTALPAEPKEVAAADSQPEQPRFGFVFSNRETWIERLSNPAPVPAQDDSAEAEKGLESELHTAFQSTNRKPAAPFPKETLT